MISLWWWEFRATNWAAYPHRTRTWTKDSTKNSFHVKTGYSRRNSWRGPRWYDPITPAQQTMNSIHVWLTALLLNLVSYKRHTRCPINEGLMIVCQRQRRFPKVSCVAYILCLRGAEDHPEQRLKREDCKTHRYGDSIKLRIIHVNADRCPVCVMMLKISII